MRHDNLVSKERKEEHYCEICGSTKHDEVDLACDSDKQLFRDAEKDLDERGIEWVESIQNI